MNPIYKPRGAAAEYGEYAINIYTGCNHGCEYCYAPAVLRKSREVFEKVEPRKSIVAEVERQLRRGTIVGETIFLCFACDPYPANIDTTPTREIIKLLKYYGNHVCILTKGGMRAERDFDLLDDWDWFGVTYAGYADGILSVPREEPNSAPIIDRLASLKIASDRGINTWVSMEPILHPADALTLLRANKPYIDRYAIGKMNHHPSDIRWGEFGRLAETICKGKHYDYTIKASLRAEMRKEERTW